MDKMREQFEARASEWGFDLRRGVDRDYEVETTDAAWGAWQVATQVALELAAEICEAYSEDQWSLYKGRSPYTGQEEGRADADVQGRSNGADVCEERIRALMEKKG